MILWLSDQCCDRNELCTGVYAGSSCDINSGDGAWSSCRGHPSSAGKAQAGHIGLMQRFCMFFFLYPKKWGMVNISCLVETEASAIFVVLGKSWAGGSQPLIWYDGSFWSGYGSTDQNLSIILIIGICYPQFGGRWRSVKIHFPSFTSYMRMFIQRFHGCK